MSFKFIPKDLVKVVVPVALVVVEVAKAVMDSQKKGRRKKSK